MNLVFDGDLFHPTGVATHHRNFVKALIRKGVRVQIRDFYRRLFDQDGFLAENAYSPVEIDSEETLQVLTYRPDMWRDFAPCRRIGYPVHEGTKLPENWGAIIDQVCSAICVPSNATRNLFASDGIKVPIYVVPEGIDPNVYDPHGMVANVSPGHFLFLSVNSWTGQENDRKGTDVLIRAFCEEFGKDEKVALFLKISAFWKFPPGTDFAPFIRKLGITGDIAPIIVNSNLITDVDLASLYRRADCFVAPTRGESFGLTIAEAIACGAPALVTRDPNSGHMDYCDGRADFIGTAGMEQADINYFSKGNLMPAIDKEDLKMQMRKIFEMGKVERKRKGLEASEFMRREYSWERAAEKFIEVVNGTKTGRSVDRN